MKGPGLRIDLDVRRTWRCAKCGKTLRTVGAVTAQRCGCADDATWMRLEQFVPRPRYVPPHREPLPEYGEEVSSAETPAATVNELVAPAAETPTQAAPPVELPTTESQTLSATPPESTAAERPIDVPPATGEGEFGAGVSGSVPADPQPPG
ncbi:MAG: hypothetical protein JSS02_27840 [Planctomycetes bacterium]|nr:hypothetical protein [Planctomycetota bacterium]